MLPYSPSIAEENHSCKIVKERVVSFSSQAQSDKIKIKIIGKTCKQAKLNITVINQKGVVLYKFEAPFEQYIVGYREDSQIYEDAISYADVILESAIWGQSASLPEWKSETEFYNENSTSVVVGQEIYKKYREQNIPVFWHPTYYEGGRHIVYDKNKKKCVILLDGGL